MKFIQNTFIVTLCLLSGLAQAQISPGDTLAKDSVKTKNLDEVDITTTSSPSKSQLDQPVSIVKMGQLELKRSTGLYLDDAINTNVPGVFMERRSTSGGQQFNIRGYGNGVRGTNGVSSNFDGQGYKVYLNGIPVTDAEGISVMDDIDFGSVGNVEIVKGPAGTLYGLAISGAVNLQTKKAEKGKVTIGQDAMFGSYGLQRLTTRLEVGGENSSILINYGSQKSDGFVAHTASEKDFVNFVGDFQPNKKQTITTYMGYSNSYDQRQGELTLGQWDTLDYSGNPAYIKNDAHSNVISFRAGVGHTYAFNKYVSNTFAVFGTGVSNNASSAGGWTDKTPMNYGASTSFNTKFTLGNMKLSGVTGGEYQKQYAQTIGYAMVSTSSDPKAYNQIGAMRSNVVTRSETYNLFTEWTLTLPSDISVIAGIGMSNMLITLDDHFYVANNPNPVKYSKGYDGMYSPHLAINKVFNRHISAYAAYSTGYKAPVSSYFFIPTTGQVNTSLKPEMGTQIEIGTKGDLMNGRLHYQLSVFSAQFSDKMTTQAVPLSPPAVGTAYSYIVNRGSLDNKGLEALVKFTAYSSTGGFIKDIKPFVNFCYSDFKYSDYTYQTLSTDKKSVVEVNYSGNAVAGVAPITANAGLDIMTKPGLFANITYSYRDAMPFTSDGVNVAKAYSLLNAKLGYHRIIAKHFDLELYAGAVNMTNTQYAYMVFINQLPDAYIPAPNEINFFGGVNLKYIF